MSQLELDHGSDPEGLHAELYQAIRCEMCNHTDGTHANPLYTCIQCYRMYHKECMHLSTPLGEDQDLVCECCRLGNADHQDRQLFVVRWAPRWEPGTVFDYDTELAPFHKNRQQQPPAAKPARPDAHLTMQERQGMHGPNRHINPLTDTARTKIKIEHQPINPHTDIQPCTEYRI
jgi:hypothetical protein